MNPVIRGFSIYLFILVLFRIMGKKSLSDSTTFDFVLLLIISEVTQQALVGQDYSLTGSFILITTLVGADLLLSLLKETFPFLGKVTEGLPLVIVDEGKPLKRRMKKTKVSEDDILESARSHFGLERMEQIKYAILEKNGQITIVPFRPHA
ncbi:MAG TPA: YetF domain-containing protein [Chryseosolibacter sp.]|nr:YetF domain-containing protein [Chryseosolibacter sp.]